MHSKRILPILLLIILLFEALVVSGAVGTNMIANNGFESGASGWNLSTGGAAVVTTHKRSGERSMHLSTESETLNPYAWKAISAGIYEYAKYKVSGYVKFEQSPSRGAAVKFEFRYWDGTYPAYQNLTQAAADMNTSYIKADGNEWVYFEEEFEMPAGCNYLKAYFRMYGSGSIYYDDVSFEMTEDPPVMKLSSDAVYYYTQWNTGTLTAEISSSFSGTMEGKNALFTIYDGDMPLISSSKKIENDFAEFTFDVSLMKVKGKEYTAVCVLKSGTTEISRSVIAIYRYDRPLNIDESGNYVVSGQVFNPVLAYHVYESQYPVCKDIGVNVVQVFLSRSASAEALNSKLDMIGSYGLKALVALYYDGKAAGNDANAATTKRIVSAISENDAVFAYAVLDEPPVTAENDLKKSYKIIRDIDSKHPVYAVECLSSLFPMVEKYVDILACDPYPGFSGSGDNPVSDFPGRDTRLAYQATKGRKPVLSVLQLIEYNGYDPVYDEVRHALYQAVSGGASYIGFYPMYEPDGFLLQNSILWDGLKKMARQDLPLIFEYIRRGNRAYSDKGNGYTAETWEIGNDKYLIAMSNSDTAPTAVNFPLEGKKAAADYNTRLTGCSVSEDILTLTLEPKELKAFKLTSGLYCTQSGMAVDSIRSGKLKITYDNPESSDTMIVALYKMGEEELRLTDIIMVKRSQSGELYTEIEGSDILKIKAFIWDGVNTIKPNAKALELKNV